MENPRPDQGPERGGGDIERPDRGDETGTDPRRTREKEKDDDRNMPRRDPNPTRTTPKTG